MITYSGTKGQADLVAAARGSLSPYIAAYLFKRPQKTSTVLLGPRFPA